MLDWIFQFIAIMMKGSLAWVKRENILDYLEGSLSTNSSHFPPKRGLLEIDPIEIDHLL